MRKAVTLFLIMVFMIQTVAFAVNNELSESDGEYICCDTDQVLLEGLHSALVEKRNSELQQELGIATMQLIKPGNEHNFDLMPSTGKVNMLVLPIGYPDYPQEMALLDEERWQELLFAPYDSKLGVADQSFRGMYYQLSNGRLDITGTVLPAYKAPLKSAEYEEDVTLWKQLGNDALTYYSEQGLDISQFDNDGDGIIDALIICEIKKHKADDYMGVIATLDGAVDGYQVKTYAHIYGRYPEIGMLDTCIHETAHLLGLPDNYWDNVIDSRLYEITASGRYFNAYYKYLLGWIEPTILTNEDAVRQMELFRVDQFSDDFESTNNAIVLIPDLTAFPYAEYYMAEYRAGGMLDLPGGHLLFDETPGIVIWHCNTYIDTHRKDKPYIKETNYLKPVYKSGTENYDNKDVYVEGDEFSSDSEPNSNFYDGTYIGAYLKVEEITSDKAVISAGFRDPNQLPGAVIEVSEPSQKVICKGETATIVVTVTVNGEPLPLDRNIAAHLHDYSTDGTVRGSGSAARIVGNTVEIEIKKYGAEDEENGFIWLDIPAGAIQYNGKDSAAVVSEKICIDNTPPEITLQGDNPQKIQQGTAYVELGAVASDNLDPDIEDKLEIDTSQVNTDALGSYTVTYSVTDHAGHSTTGERTVIVEEGLPPHTHDYATAWSSDETGHWHECECGEKGDFAAHTVVTDPAVESTCTTHGKTQGSHCSVCGFIITAQTETQLKAHSYSGEWSQDETNHWHECSVCQNKSGTAAHTENAGTVTKQPTVDETGIRTYSCSTCGRELRTETIARLEPSHTHNYSTVWSMDKTDHWHECECGENADLAAHTAVVDPAEEATCTAYGKSEGSHCSVCGYIIKAQTETPLKTHSYSSQWSQDADNHWRECFVCHNKTETGAHTEDGGTVTKAPTEEEEGLRTYSCSTCGRELRRETIAKLNPSHTHSYSETWSSDAANHWRECTVCQEKADQAPHAWNSGEVTTAPTASKAGVRTYTCTVCKRTRTETIPATGGTSSSGGGSGGGGSSSGGGGGGRPANKKPEQTAPEPPVEVVPEPPVEITPEPVKLPFTDVAKTAWYYEAVQAVYEQGIMTGMTETLFEPELPTSRGMVVTMLYRMEGEPATKAEETFTDVPVGRYYADAVAWCVENGIVTGYGDGTFRPDIRITREQLVTILYRYWAKKGYDVTGRADLSGFFDEDRITGYARESVEWANATGLLGGADWGGIDPGGAATRGQVAAVLERLLINQE